MADATDAIVDARGMRCPWPALRLAKAMCGAAAATLLADDPNAGREVAALAEAQGWRVEPVDGGWRVSRYFLPGTGRGA